MHLVSYTNEKTSRKQTLQQESYQKNKHLGFPPCKILGTILQINKRRTSINGPEKKKTHNEVLHPRDDRDLKRTD